MFILATPTNLPGMLRRSMSCYGHAGGLPHSLRRVSTDRWFCCRRWSSDRGGLCTSYLPSPFQIG